MILGSKAGRTAALGGALVGTALVAVGVTGVPLRTDEAFVVASPRDGAVVGDGALFSWGASAGASAYAVIVDGSLPRPGQVVSPTARVVMVTATSVRLTLGRAKTGSPSSRGFHTVTVLPLDGGGRRIGRDAAVVHVRNS